MSEKRANSSFQIDLEGTTRSNTLFNSRTPRTNSPNKFQFRKRHSLIPEIGHRHFNGRSIICKFAEKKAIIEPFNVITKEVIAAISAKIIKLKENRRAKLSRQKMLCETLNKYKNIKKEIDLEEESIMRQLNDLGKKRVSMKRHIEILNTEVHKTKHDFESIKFERNKCNKELKNKIYELRKELENSKIILENQYEDQRNELNNLQCHRQNFDAENRMVKNMLNEMEEKHYLASITENKSINEFKHRIRELSSILNNV